MNFLEVNIQKQKDNLYIELPLNNSLSIPLKKMRKIDEEYLDGDVHSAILGIRSEDILIQDKGDFKAKVSVIETLGSETLLYSDFDVNKDINIRESQTAIVIKVPGRIELNKDKMVNISFNLDKIHLFKNDNDKEESILGESIGQ